MRRGYAGGGGGEGGVGGVGGWDGVREVGRVRGCVGRKKNGMNALGVRGLVLGGVLEYILS